LKNILLDVNIVADFCLQRFPHFPVVHHALNHAERSGHRLWLYTGSLQTILYVLENEIRRHASLRNQSISQTKALDIASKQMQIFTRDKQWLAALAEDGSVLEDVDPEDQQLIKATSRLGKDGLLMTRDKKVLASCPQAISPQAYLEIDPSTGPMDFIDLSCQQDCIRPSLENRIFSVLRHGQYIMGPEVKELEVKLAAYVGAKHAVGCASGTDALLMALMAYGVGPGDAIFTTPFTFIATAEVISLLGATPVFVDIDPKTYNIDPAKLEQAIQAVKANDPSSHPLPLNSALSPQSLALIPKGIIPVDLFGLPADYDAINAIAKDHGLFVVEDAAQSFGAEYKGKKACSLADIACTSFFPAKPLGCYGDGGMCFTDDDQLAKIMESIRVHGKGSDKYDNIRIGINGRLDTLQAAILLSKFAIFPDEVILRQEAANRYAALLAPYSSLLTPYVAEGYNSVWAQYSVLAIDGDHRTALQKRLQENKIPTAIYYPKPLHLQTAFTFLGYVPGAFPVSEDAANRIFSLPMHPYLQKEDQTKIAEIMKSAC
jgi:dTDP-4-amino-4,6-dideoxygalactose transaminase